MHLDHPAADGLGVEVPGIAREVSANPVAAIILDPGIMRGMNRPIVERAFAAGTTGDVAPPARLPVHDGDVGADMTTFEKRHPHVTSNETSFVLGLRAQHAASHAHTLEVDDRLGEHGKARRRYAMGPGIEPLTLRDRDLVVDPMIVRVPNPGVTVFGWNVNAGRTGGLLEILQAPGVRFTDRHGAKISAG